MLPALLLALAAFRAEITLAHSRDFQHTGAAAGEAKARRPVPLAERAWRAEQFHGAYGDAGRLARQLLVKDYKEIPNGGDDKLKVSYPALMAYYEDMRKQPLVNCTLAALNQSRPTSADVGITVMDPMRDLETLPARVGFLNHLYNEVCTNATGRPGHGALLRVAMYSMWSGDLWGLRRTLVQWLQWHTHIGVCRFYVAYPGRDVDTVQMLRQIKSVKLIFIQRPFATVERNREWTTFAAKDEWGRRPGNWRQMSKQGFAGDIAFRHAREEGMNWMMHLDADEMLVPGDANLLADLQQIPKWAASVTVFNLEAAVEVVDVINKFEQITLFKRHENFGPVQTPAIAPHFAVGTTGSVYQVYYNGKAIGRTDGGPIRMWGVHAFIGDRSDVWKDPVHNPEGKFMTYEAPMLSLLHYSYTNYHDLMGKATRACPFEYQRAVRVGNMTKLRECFCLEFDMMAYVAAVKGVDAAREFWVRESLYSEGSVHKDGDDNGQPLCRVFRDMQRLKRLLVRNKLLMRNTVIQQTLRAHEVAIRALARSMGIDIASVIVGRGSALMPLTTTVRRRRRGSRR